MSRAIRPTREQARQFKAEIKAYTDGLLPQQVLQFTKVLAMHILRGVVSKTPVGNPTLWKHPAPKGYVGGHARMNWQVSLQAPVTGEIPGADATGFTATMTGLVTMAGAKAYQPIWITNNVPYILVLENGRGPVDGVMRGSAQAPHGMLGVTMQELRRDFGAV